MSRTRLLSSGLVALALTTAACGGAADTTTAAPNTAPSSSPSAPSASESHSADASAEPVAPASSEPASPAPAPTEPAAPESSAPAESASAASSETAPVTIDLQASAALADGGTVRLADFAGQTIFVETFATWCSKCRTQLTKTNEAAASSDAVFLVLSVEEGLSPEKVAQYRDSNGFNNVIFGVLDSQSLSNLNQRFGRTVLNAPSVPSFVIAADGTVRDLVTGQESVEQILERVRA